MIKTAIFDFDGTLADTIPLCREAFRRIEAEKNGFPLRSSPPFSSHSSCSQVAFIQLKDS